jgi:hypothetical protein
VRILCINRNRARTSIDNITDNGKQTEECEYQRYFVDKQQKVEEHAWTTAS